MAQRAFTDELMLPRWVAEERHRQRALYAALGAALDDGFPEPLTEAGPWSFATVIGWWLKAGHALHRIPEARRRELERCVGLGAGEGIYPPLWLAARYTAMHLPPDGLPAHFAASEAWAAQHAVFPAYLQELLLWITNVDSKVRPRFPAEDPAKNPQGWITLLQQEFVAIRDDAAALLGDRFDLETGPDLSLETVADWRPIWLDWRSGDVLIHRVRPPVLHVSGERRSAFIKGVAVLQPPGSLVRAAVERLLVGRSATAQGDVRPAAAATAARLLGEVAAHWPARLLPSTEVREALKRRPTAPDLVDRLVLPAVRVMVAALAMNRKAARSSTDCGDTVGDDWQGALAALRLALALDGFSLRPVAPSAAGCDRMIPHRGDPGQGCLSLSFICKSADIDVSVGQIGESAECDEELLAAIETIDWRLWAYDRALPACGDAAVATLVVRAAKLPAWEQLKRSALRHPEASVLDRLFDHAHTRGLSMRLLRDRVPATGTKVPMLDELIDDYGTLARTAIERLTAADPDGPSRLAPPRRADGSVDVAAWLARRLNGGAAPADWRPEWVPHERPRGEVLGERREGKEYVVTISAGGITAGDLELLRMPVPAANDATSEPGTPAETLRGFQAAAAQSLVGGANTDVGSALEALRSDLAGARAAAFHDLVQLWRGGDEAATQWIRTLAADPRFRYACHPRVDPETAAVAPVDIDDPYLEWAFSADVPAGADVAITFAIEPSRARRVVSRGPRIAGAAADRADDVVAVAPAGPLADRAAEARRGLDLWTQFPQAAPHPVAAVSRLLDGLLEAGSAPAAVRTAVFTAVKGWCTALGHDVVPADWSPDRPVPPESLAGENLAREFHADVPAGIVVIRRFGIRGPAGVPFSGAISAGPAPPGFSGLREAVRELLAAGPAWAMVAQRVDDLPKHALADTQRLAGSNLYDAFWEAAAIDVAPAFEDPIAAARTALIELLRAAGGMVPFEPSAVGDYPSGWIREADGRQPRGRRIRRLVRPGLRTIDNALVRPALVISE